MHPPELLSKLVPVHLTVAEMLDQIDALRASANVLRASLGARESGVDPANTSREAARGVSVEQDAVVERIERYETLIEFYQNVIAETDSSFRAEAKALFISSLKGPS